MPQGDFADDDEDDAIYYGSGVASTGLYLGYKLLSPFKTDGLYWTFNVGIMYNDLQSHFKDDLKNLYDDADDYSLPKYLNVPILPGLQYKKSLSDGFELFGEFALGLNVLKLTNRSASYDHSERKTTFNPSVKLGYKIGTGIVLQDKYTISLNYMGLGSHRVKYEMEQNGNSYEDRFERQLSVSSLNITFGIPF